MKESILRVSGQDIAIQFVAKKGYIRYGKNSIKEWLVQDGFEEDSVDEDLKNKKDFLTRKQTLEYLKSVYPYSEYRQKLSWLNKEVEPSVIKLMKNVPEGTKLRIINGLAVREHPNISGLYSLTDAWKAARSFFTNKSSWEAKNARQWQKSNKKLINDLIEVLDNSVAKSPLYLVSINKGGRSPITGTYAHPRLLIAYTEFVHSKLHSQVLKVFEDFEDGVLHSNEALTRRAKGTQERKDSIEEYKEFNLHTKHVGANTPNVLSKGYFGLLEKPWKSFLKERGIKPPHRDNIDLETLIEIRLMQDYTRMLYVKLDVDGQLEAEQSALEAGKFVRFNREALMDHIKENTTLSAKLDEPAPKKVRKSKKIKSNVFPFKKRAA